MKKHFNYDFEYLITIKDDAIIGSHIFTASTLDNFQMNDLINCFAYLDQSLLGFPLTFLLVNFIYYNLLAVLLISKFYLFFKYFQSQDFFILLLYYFRLFMVILYLIMRQLFLKYVTHLSLLQDYYAFKIHSKKHKNSLVLIKLLLLISKSCYLTFYLILIFYEVNEIFLHLTYQHTFVIFLFYFFEPLLENHKVFKHLKDFCSCLN